MARRHRRHRRHRRYGDPVISMPSFGGIEELNPLGKTVHSTDVMIGVGIGLAGGGLVQYLQKRFWPTAPAVIQTYSGPLSALAAGAAAYSLYRKKSRGRAQGYLAGAVAVGVIPALYAVVKGALPTSVTQYFGDPLLQHNFGSYLVGAPALRPQFGSMIVSSPPVPPFGMDSPLRALGY